MRLYFRCDGCNKFRPLASETAHADGHGRYFCGLCIHVQRETGQGVAGESEQ